MPIFGNQDRVLGPAPSILEDASGMTEPAYDNMLDKRADYTTKETGREVRKNVMGSVNALKSKLSEIVTENARVKDPDGFADQVKSAILEYGGKQLIEKMSAGLSEKGLNVAKKSGDAAEKLVGPFNQVFAEIYKVMENENAMDWQGEIFSKIVEDMSKEAGDKSRAEYEKESQARSRVAEKIAKNNKGTESKDFGYLDLEEASKMRTMIIDKMRNDKSYSVEKAKAAIKRIDAIIENGGGKFNAAEWLK